jgi:sterol O-acyltransferase
MYHYSSLISLFVSQWEWVQSGFFTLHALVMLMKIHSYLSVNGNFSELSLQLEAATKTLDSLVSRLPGGREKAEQDAAAARQEKEKENGEGFAHTNGSTHGSVTPAGTPMMLPEGHVIGTADLMNGGLTAASLRNRLQTVPERASGQLSSTTAVVGTSTPGSITPPQQDNSYFTSDVVSDDHSLIGHPDPTIDAQAKEVEELTQSLRGKSKVQWPQNVTLANFVDYQLIPTLVYELEYPRTDR